jgi:NAD(P)-dependent dehydrogenase (short-subunit alcohol dehydrogenase family)
LSISVKASRDDPPCKRQSIVNSDQAVSRAGKACESTTDRRSHTERRQSPNAARQHANTIKREVDHVFPGVHNPLRNRHDEERKMTGLLEQRIAVVTGSGSGIGQAIAQGYAREGAQVAVLDVDGDAAAETAKAITAAGGRALSFVLDVTEFDKCRVVAAQISDKLGRVSILVNNAGINRRNAFTADPEAVIKDWQDIMAVNLNGVFNVTHAFLGQLRATRGRIVNIGSVQSFVHVRTPNSPAYTTSKHGVLGFTRALAAELGKDGIRVNAIGPGLIETPLNEKVRANNPDLVKIFIDHTPLGRTGKPEDIVGPAIFLASDLSAYVTGSIIMADGGYRVL